MDDENLENRLNDIRNLYKIINNVKSGNKKFLLNHKLQTELDFLIDRIEEHYYCYVLKGKKEDKIKNETDKIIYNSRKTMNAFLPYILLYNITENQNQNENQNEYQNQNENELSSYEEGSYEEGSYEEGSYEENEFPN